jgi:hypothetical protein
MARFIKLKLLSQENKMSQHNIKFKMSDEGITDMKFVSNGCMIKEQAEAIKHAFNEIEIGIEIDDDWGICKITHVNGREVLDE